MKIKARICDLQKGDLFEAIGSTFKVTAISDTEVIFYRWNEAYQSGESVKHSRGKNSLELVYLVPKKVKEIKNQDWCINKPKKLKTAI